MTNLICMYARPGCVISPSRIQDMTDRYLSGESPRRIADSMEVHFQSVYYHLRKEGVLGTRMEHWREIGERRSHLAGKLGSAASLRASGLSRKVRDTLSVHDDLGRAFSLVSEGVRRMPVFDGRRLVGTITAMDILRNVADLVSTQRPRAIAEYMTSPITVRAQDSIFEVARKIIEEGVSGVWVIDRGGVLIGEITQMEFVRIVKELARDDTKRGDAGDR